MALAAAEVAVVGGGLVGAAIAWGISRTGAPVTILDGADDALRASRGNFALIWVQGKGLGLPAYASWTRSSAEEWSCFAQDLQQESGLDLHFHRSGGFRLCLSEGELASCRERMERLGRQTGIDPQPYEVMSASRTKEYLPHVGPEVAGSIYSPQDGHVNSLQLLRALHVALARRTANYLPGCVVHSIRADRDGFLLRWAGGGLRARKVVLAAGLGNVQLAPMVGLQAPVRPVKGHIIVTEKVAPFLRYPVATLRQSDEGSVMIGDSQQEAGVRTDVELPVLSVMASRAVRMFPLIGSLRIVRTWAALRVMTPDGFPIYDVSDSCPGAFVVTSHSAVTLAAVHTLRVAPAIASGQWPDTFAAFSARRFVTAR